MTSRLVALIIPLGLDTFAVCAALGMAGLPRRQRLRVSALMTAFEGGMPLVGLALGAPLGHALGKDADYIAAAVLIAVGLYMALADEDEPDGRRLASVHGWGPSRWASVSASTNSPSASHSGCCGYRWLS